MENTNNADDMVKINIKHPLQELYKVKSSMLCEIARVNWQLNGGKDTHFFHKINCNRRKSNSILRLSSSRGWITKPSEIKSSIFNHFASLLGSGQERKIFDLQDELLN